MKNSIKQGVTKFKWTKAMKKRGWGLVKPSDKMWDRITKALKTLDKGFKVKKKA